MIKLAVAIAFIAVFGFVVFLCVMMTIRFFKYLDRKEEAKDKSINSQPKPKTDNEN